MNVEVEKGQSNFFEYEVSVPGQTCRKAGAQNHGSVRQTAGLPRDSWVPKECEGSGGSIFSLNIAR